MIPTFVKSYEASADVSAYRIAKFSDAAASRKVALATAATDPMIGVIDKMAGLTGEMVDVHLAGLASVELGGTVTAGAPLTSDATGRAIVATVAVATNKRVIGVAHEPGVVGDIIDVWLAPAPLYAV